jgi:SAM-dependent methyltransferase
MKYFTLGHRLPSLLAVPLYGDRARFGLVVNEKDECWQKWQTECVPFYEATQRKSVGARVSDAGYRVMEWVDLTGKKVLEIGPGAINHSPYWKNRPAKYVVADIRQEMLEKATKRLQELEIEHESVMLNREDRGELPFADDEFDVILTFYSLEHLYPFQPYLEGMLRVLKPGGQIVGAIPAEGGLGWGLGRYLTSRRWLKKNTQINPDKIICWEHPMFTDEILSRLDNSMRQRRLGFWPFRLPSIDLNLVVRFLYEKR